MTPARTARSVAALIALAGTAWVVSPAAAQTALGDGTALDASPSSQGRVNPARPSFSQELQFRNAIVTGNAPGGLSFRGDLGYRAPGFERSAHLRFDAVDPDGNTVRLSLFVMPDNGLLPLAEGVTHKLDAAACEKAGVRAFVWRNAGTVHLLVSEAGGSFCPAVRDLLNAPRTVAGL